MFSEHKEILLYLYSIYLILASKKIWRKIFSDLWYDCSSWALADPRDTIKNVSNIRSWPRLTETRLSFGLGNPYTDEYSYMLFFVNHWQNSGLKESIYPSNKNVWLLQISVYNWIKIIFPFKTFNNCISPIFSIPKHKK